MHRVFLHVDEFGRGGMLHLPYSVCVSGTVIVWAPSSLLLDATTESFLTPSALLSLVDRADAPVRVIGREEWLLSKEFRNSHPWPMAAWNESFDGVLRRFALEDSTRPLQKRRVIIAGRERGFEAAQSLLDGENGTAISRRLNRLFQSGALPIGILEKARRDRSARKSVPRLILRDMINHSDAMRESEAQCAATPCEHMAVLQGIVPNSVTATGMELPLSNALASSEDVAAAVRLLTAA